MRRCDTRASTFEQHKFLVNYRVRFARYITVISSNLGRICTKYCTKSFSVLREENSTETYVAKVCWNWRRKKTWVVVYIICKTGVERGLTEVTRHETCRALRSAPRSIAPHRAPFHSGGVDIKCDSAIRYASWRGLSTPRKNTSRNVN